MLSVITLFSLQIVVAQEIVINEVMSSNSLTYADEDGDFSDWVEIYNPGSLPVNLSGFGFSDNLGDVFKWIFPDTTVQPQEYILVWASGKDRVTGRSLHANFSISAAGEPLLLSGLDGSVLDEFPGIQIPTDVSYGRQPNGGDTFLFFSVPTPGQANHDIGFGEMMDAPVFSHEGGFYAEDFNLTISSPDPSASIIYTLDGSVPDPENISGTTYSYKNKYPEQPGEPYGNLLNNSFKSHSYSGPISIEDRSSDANKLSMMSSTYHQNPWYFPKSPVYKGIVVKAKAVKPGALASNSITHTYFISPEAGNRYSVPVISLSIQEDALFDYEKGIYVAGKDFDDWRGTNATEGADGSKPANYKRSGSDWEYPAHLEVFDGAKGRVLSQTAGIRIHGGWSTSHPAKSIRLYARNQMGEPYFEHPFFQDRPDMKHKRILLRNSGNDWGYTMFRDAAIQSIVGHMDFETMAYQPAVLFINSEYWGIHNIRERFDKYYFEAVYGVDPENIDILEGNMWPDEGDAVHYKETMDYIKANGLTASEHYEYIKTRIDVNSFMDYQIAQIFVGNTDWPGNNIKFWRLKTSQFDAAAPPGHDGRWRWMLYDTDFGFGIYDSNAFTEDVLSLATAPDGPGWPNPPWSTSLFRDLLENKSFKNDFINRFSDQLNTAFQPSVVKDKINNISEKLEPEIEEHIQRWNAPRNLTQWTGNVAVMLNFADKRPGFQREHLKNYFKLGNLYDLTIDVSHPAHGFVKVNSLELRSGTEGLPETIFPWKGRYFAGVPLQIEAVAAPGFVFAGWQGANGQISEKMEIQPSGNMTIKAIFKSEVPHLIHYWNFNNEDNLLEPSYTFTNAALEVLPGEMSEVTTGTENGFVAENAQFKDLAESHIRINNPLTSEMTFKAPTTGFAEVFLKFEARRSGQGAGTLVIEHTIDGINFIEKEQLTIYNEDPRLYSVDFSSLEAASKNALFAIKIRFAQGDGGITGNTRFDNITLEGKPEEPVLSILEVDRQKIVIEAYPNPFQNENTIRINAPKQLKVKIFLQDLNGVVYQEIPSLDLKPGKNEIKMDHYNLSRGVYLLHFQFESYKAVVKLIKI